jgi:hypothetical protein
MNPSITRTPATSRSRAVAVLLGAAAVLWIGAYLQHPPGEGVSLARTMQVVAEHTAAWRWSHLGIAAGYLAAGIAAALHRPRVTSGIARTGWLAVGLGSVPLVVYLVVESTVATQAALAGDADAFALWYGTVAVWTWRVAWPVFFAGTALVAIGSLGSRLMPQWATWLAVAGALFAMLAPLFSAAGLSSLSLAAFIAPIATWLWLAFLGARYVRSGRSDD